MPKNTKTYHWKIILLISLLFLSYAFANDSFPTVSKFFLITPLPLMVYLLLIIWPQYIALQIQKPRRIVILYSLNYFLMVVVFAFIYYIIAKIETSFHGLCFEDSSATDYLYYSMITATTVGYGDMFPTTEFAKCISIIEPFLSTVFFVAALSVFLNKESINNNNFPVQEDQSQL